MVDLEKADPDFFARQGAYTRQIHRDVYPSIDPRSKALSQDGKVVIITGSSSGLGARGIAPAFAAAGARAIVLVGRRRDKIAECASALRRQFPSVEFLEAPADVSSIVEVDAVFDSIKSAYGSADVLINNAGVLGGSGALSDSDPAAWWSNFQINTFGTYLMTRSFLNALDKSKRGSIISISSGASTVVLPGMSSYGGSKLIVNRFAEYVALENPNVTSVTLDPGTVDTDMVLGEYFLPHSHRSQG